MNTSNSFKQILEEDELRFPPPPEIEAHVFGSLQILSIMGQAMELYIPKVFEMFIMTLGGTIKEIDQAGKDGSTEGHSGTDKNERLPGIAGFSINEPPL